MNRRKPKTSKIISGLNLGPCHHALNSCCPSKASRSEQATGETWQFDARLSIRQLLESGDHWRPGIYYNTDFETRKFITDITGFMLVLIC